MSENNIPDGIQEWLEESIKGCLGVGAVSWVMVGIGNDETFTAYWKCGATDKAVAIHNIKIDILEDLIRENSDRFREILEGDDE